MTDQLMDILLVEDDKDHADLFRRSLEEVPELSCRLTCATNPDEARRALRGPDIDLIVLDYRLGIDTGLTFLRALRAEGEWRPVIVLTGHGNEYVAVEMMRAGATDYLVKADLRPNILGRAIDKARASMSRARAEHDEVCEVASRLAQLTPREREVMELVVAGLTTPQIGRKLHRSINTVKIHRTNLMRKMGASTPADLARMVTGSGLAAGVSVVGSGVE